MTAQDKTTLLGLATELSAALEEITDKRSQYGRPSVDEPMMLKRCRYLADQLEQGLKPEPTWSPTGGDAA